MATGFSKGIAATRLLRPTVDAPCREVYEKQCREIYRKQCRRIYSLAYWMTNSRNAAQRLALRTFLRAFTLGGCVGTEQIDQAFLVEVHGLIPMDAPLPETLSEPAPEKRYRPIHRVMKKLNLETVVAQLPGAERLIFLLHDVEAYDQARICRLLHCNTSQVLNGLHRARMRIRELVARM
jgi:DNA-directed RNA polymerase specialized sigma24 family protein